MKNRKKHTILKQIFALFLVTIFVFNAYPLFATKTTETDTRELNAWVEKFVEWMTNDGFHPPLSARTYTYIFIAGYESSRFGSHELKSFSGKLKNLSDLPRPDNDLAIHFPLAGIVAMSFLSENLLYRPEEVLSKRRETIAAYEALLDKNTIENSIEYGLKAGKHILDWQAKDGYLETRAMGGYELKKQPESWEPTPPDYQEAFEPFWHTLRNLIQEHPGQFADFAPFPFSTADTSRFYRAALEVLNHNNNASQEEIEIALFWDDNPAITVHFGHLMIPRKQISPASHWIKITQKVSNQTKKDFYAALKSYVLVSIALHEAGISSFYTKYKWDLIRPVSYINRYIDPTWQPRIVTPPFPEYVSAHSTFSSAAAEVLTHQYGDNFSYDDDIETIYGHPVRSFSSFRQAAQEVGMSRLYGGIHYSFGNRDGLILGSKIGNYVIEKLAR